MTPRRHDDEDDEGVLSRRARPAWGLILMIGTVLAGASAVLAAQNYVAVAAAQDVVAVAVAPVEKKIDDHLAAVQPKQDLMMQYVQEQREINRAMSKKLDALCRASPKANCPLGDR